MKKNIFTQVQMTKPSKSVFDLTHDVKMSGRMGNLMPCLTLECVPGDTMKLGADTLIRFAPMIAPVMHRIDVSIHYFFVPNRIVWPGWEDFITDGTPTPLAPFFQINGGLPPSQNLMLDYMGVPPFDAGGGSNLNISAIPFAAYQHIYNEFYRDENLVTELAVTLQDGSNPTGNYLAIRKRAWEHDLYTSALPFAQKGSAVDIPLGDVNLKTGWSTSSTPSFENDDGSFSNGAISQNTSAGSPIELASTGTARFAAYDPEGSLEVQATTINDLRRAFRLQEWLEKNARGGTRYIENILSHFGVKSSDQRLQRPEYITGIKSPVVISEVLNTSGIDGVGELPQGNMAGHGVSVTTGKSGSYTCEEHGYIIGIVSIMPKSTYQQGIPKTFLKFDELDYYWPSFAHIGEQEIIQDEVMAYHPGGTDVFGYVPRYSEYKYFQSRVAGDFRTSQLDFWHMGRIFSSLVALNQDFIEMDADDVDRVFAVTAGDDNIYMHILNKIKAIRPMPYFGNPSL